ncbi:MAG TPA: FAD-binding protein [Acidimicrobiales bacterium]|nr:FAD-binding protein [Acidimicrobiales bacterium]
MDLAAFAEEVGAKDPVVPVGGRTQWTVGGPAAADGREVRAPSGVVEFTPAEMTARVGAGTTVTELDAALAEAGQTVALPAWPDATVGGVLSVGHSGLRRLGWGPVRNTLLEARYVSAEGTVVKAGGPVVKNVTGYDLCRLLVGSLGTVGILAEVVVRTRPLPAVSRWFAGPGADPFATRHALHAPSSLLWDGTTVWVLLEGHGADVDQEHARMGAVFTEVDGPPPIPTGGRESRRPSELRDLDGVFVAEIGVGTVHRHEAVPPREVTASIAELQRRVKAVFDPTGRLNPGRQVP